MKIWHIYARHYNFGDHALGLAVRNLFRKYFAKDSVFETLDTCKLWIDGRIVHSINQDADFVLVGGGGLIHTFGLGGRAWLFHLPTCLVRSLSSRLAVFGVGFNQFRADSQILLPSVIENLLAIKEVAVAFSVRNDGSRECMAVNGILADEIPDPGFFLNSNYPAPDIKRKYVIFQLAFDAISSRGINKEKLIREMQVLTKVVIARGFDIVLAPHCRADIEISEIVKNRCENKNAVHLWDFYSSISDDCIHEHLGIYKHAQMVVAMRGHAQIIPAGMGVPFITIANHRKHQELAARLDMEEYCVDIADDLQTILPKKIELLLQNRELLSKQLLYKTEIAERGMASYISKIREDYNSMPRWKVSMWDKTIQILRKNNQRILNRVRY